MKSRKIPAHGFWALLACTGVAAWFAWAVWSRGYPLEFCADTRTQVVESADGIDLDDGSLPASVSKTTLLAPAPRLLPFQEPLRSLSLGMVPPAASIPSKLIRLNPPTGPPTTSGVPSA